MEIVDAFLVDSLTSFLSQAFGEGLQIGHSLQRTLHEDVWLSDKEHGACEISLSWFGFSAAPTDKQAQEQERSMYTLMSNIIRKH